MIRFSKVISGNRHLFVELNHRLYFLFPQNKYIKSSDFQRESQAIDNFTLYLLHLSKHKMILHFHETVVLVLYMVCFCCNIHVLYNGLPPRKRVGKNMYFTKFQGFLVSLVLRIWYFRDFSKIFTKAFSHEKIFIFYKNVFLTSRS